MSTGVLTVKVGSGPPRGKTKTTKSSASPGINRRFGFVPDCETGRKGFIYSMKKCIITTLGTVIKKLYWKFNHVTGDLVW